MKLAPTAQKLADLATWNDWIFYDRYSGRNMLGERCPGIVCAASQVGAVRSAARRAGIKGEARQDSMGRDAIIYWPEADRETVDAKSA